MNENGENIVNGGENNTPDTGDIKGTEYVEPNGKVRKIVKIVLTGLAAVATFTAGLLTGKALEGRGDDADGKDDTTENKD